MIYVFNYTHSSVTKKTVIIKTVFITSCNNSVMAIGTNQPISTKRV